MYLYKFTDPQSLNSRQKKGSLTEQVHLYNKTKLFGFCRKTYIGHADTSDLVNNNYVYNIYIFLSYNKQIYFVITFIFLSV